MNADRIRELAERMKNAASGPERMEAAMLIAEEAPAVVERLRMDAERWAKARWQLVDFGVYWDETAAEHAIDASISGSAY